MATILVVDDRPTNRQYLTTLLGYLGYQLLEAADGAEALALTRERRPDLIITDILMPTMNGYDLVQALRADPALADIPIIFYTATYKEREARSLGNACGVSLVIPKPAEPALIIETVTQALGGPAPVVPLQEGPSRPQKPPAITLQAKLERISERLNAQLANLKTVSQQWSGLVQVTEELKSEHEQLGEIAGKLSDEVNQLNIANLRFATLVELDLNLFSERDPAQVLQLFCDASRKIVGCAASIVLRLGDDERAVQQVFTSGLPPEAARQAQALPAGEGLLAHLFQAQLPVRLPDPETPMQERPCLPGYGPVQSLLSLRLASSAQLYGLFILLDKQGKAAFDDEDVELALTLASQVVSVYENITLYEQIQRHAARLTIEITERKKAETALRQYAERLAAINRLDRAISSSLDIAIVYEAFIEEIKKLFTVDYSAIILLDETPDSYTILRQWQGGQSSSPGKIRHPLPGTAIARALEQRSPYLEGASGEPVRFQDYPGLPDAGIRCRALVPLIVQNNVIGMLSLASAAAKAYQPGDLELLQALADQLAIAIQNAHLYEQVQGFAEGLEQQVRMRTAQLEKANRELEAFSYSVSHDLKAPLRGIEGYSRLLLEDYLERLDADGQYFVQSIRSATLQMGDLIDDLLAYSRLERRPLRQASVDPRVIVEALLAERADEIRESGLRVEVNLPFDSLNADPDGLAMALRNLVDNAIKFTRTVDDPQVQIGGRETDGGCVVWVKDNGIGFDMKFAERIFEIFQRLHRSEDYPGTGIGLALVRKAMERMGGRAWAESRPGEGATFYLEVVR